MNDSGPSEENIEPNFRQSITSYESVIIVIVGNFANHWARAPEKIADKLSKLIVKEFVISWTFITEEDELSPLCDESKTSKRTAIIVVLQHQSQAKKILARLVRSTNRVVWIHSLKTGIDGFDLTGLASEIKHIPFTNARGIFAPMLAEYTLGCVWYFSRQVDRILKNKRRRRWEPFSCKPIRNQTMGIIGYGNVGKTTGKLAASFGMNVVGIRRTGVAGIDDIGVDVRVGDDLEIRREVYAVSDFVVFALPLNQRTAGLINERDFRAMKPSAIAINIGRGATLSESALIYALETNTIAGAALDVFAEEPLPVSSPLWSIPNAKLFLSPHNADICSEVVDSAVRQLIELLRLFLSEKPFPFLVDPLSGY